MCSNGRYRRTVRRRCWLAGSCNTWAAPVRSRSSSVPSRLRQADNTPSASPESSALGGLNTSVSPENIRKHLITAVASRTRDANFEDFFTHWRTRAKQAHACNTRAMGTTKYSVDLCLLYVYSMVCSACDITNYLLTRLLTRLLTHLLSWLLTYLFTYLIKQVLLCWSMFTLWFVPLAKLNTYLLYYFYCF